MLQKILGIFDRKPLIWFHYVLLTGVIVGFFGILFEMKVTITTAVLLFLAVSIADQLIHYILGVD